jgi:hypothetical protein
VLAISAADPARTLDHAVELCEDGGMTSQVAARPELYEGQAPGSVESDPSEVRGPGAPELPDGVTGAKARMDDPHRQRVAQRVRGTPR